MLHDVAQWLRTLAAFPQDLGSDSQHLYGGSQASIYPVPKDTVPSSGLSRHCTHMVH